MTTSDYALTIEPHFVKNFWPGRDGYAPIAIVEHMMQGTLEDTRKYFNGEIEEYYVSAHYGIGRDGRIWQFVRDEDTAWSNGVLNAPDVSIDWIKEVQDEKVNANLVTLSIEYEGFSGAPLPEAQYEAALFLHRRLLERWEIPTDVQHIIGHASFDSVERKLNPGPAFPWTRLLDDLSRVESPFKTEATPVTVEHPPEPEPVALVNSVDSELDTVWPQPRQLEEHAQPSLAQAQVVAQPQLEEVMPQPTLAMPDNYSTSQAILDPLAALDDLQLDTENLAESKIEKIDLPTAPAPLFPDFDELESLLDAIGSSRPPLGDTTIKPFEIEGAPHSSAPLSSAPKPAEKLEAQTTLPDDTSGLLEAIIGSGAIKVELANIRKEPGLEPASILRTATKGTRFHFDGYKEGPKLPNSPLTRWLHIGPVDGSGWVHVALVELDKPFEP